MKKVLVLFCLSTIIFSCVKGQSIKSINSISKVKKIEQDIPMKGDAIRYYFPSIVDSLLTNLVTANPETKYFKEKTKYFIEFNQCENTYEVFLQGYNSELDKDTTDKLIILLNSTNRYYQIENIEIPIYFSSDYYCAFPNFGFTGADLYVKFEGRYSEKGKILSYQCSKCK